MVLASVEAFLSFLCILVGLPILINPTTLAPGSIMALLPLPLVYWWATGLTVGGGASLYGIIAVEPRIERAGVLCLGTTTAIYALALLPLFPTSMMTLVTYVLFSLSMAARFWVLGQVLARRSPLEEG